MKKFLAIIPLILILLICPVSAQDENADPAAGTVEGTWITQSGNMLEITQNGNDLSMYFPVYARTMHATWDGTTVVYITHYNDPEVEDVYINVPDADIELCRHFIRRNEPRHRFTLSLSGDGMVLEGIKEINVLNVNYEIDEAGNRFGHTPTIYEWEYKEDYQWRRINCDFGNLPEPGGNIVRKYELVETLMSRFGLAAEFHLDDFDLRDRVKFSYAQAFIDNQTGEYVPQSDLANHPKAEELDGWVYWDPDKGMYMAEIYPYSFSSHIALLSGLSLVFHELNACEASEEIIDVPTTEMQVAAVNYVWQHRQALCALDEEEFSRHIDVLSRALEYRALNEQ
ncbi:MAG TPA: hypothetical protein VGB30_08300 [bacterium]|jgi:hypothetical protein